MARRSLIMTRNDLPGWSAPPSPKPESSSSETIHQAPDISEGRQALGMWRTLRRWMWVADLIGNPALRRASPSSISMNNTGASRPMSNNQIPEVVVDRPESSSKLANLTSSMSLIITFTVASPADIDLLAQQLRIKASSSQSPHSQTQSQPIAERQEGFSRKFLHPGYDHLPPPASNVGSQAQHPAVAPEERSSSEWNRSWKKITLSDYFDSWPFPRTADP